MKEYPARCPEMTDPPEEEPIPPREDEYEWPGIEPPGDEVPWAPVSPDDPPLEPEEPNPN